MTNEERAGEIISRTMEVLAQSSQDWMELAGRLVAVLGDKDSSPEATAGVLLDYVALTGKQIGRGLEIETLSAEMETLQ